MDLKDPNRPRFTLQELRDVLHERNELKSRVFLLQEELLYYKRWVTSPVLLDDKLIGKKILNGDPVLGADPWLIKKSSIDLNGVWTDLFAFLQQQCYLRLNCGSQSASMAWDENINYLFFLSSEEMEEETRSPQPTPIIQPKPSTQPESGIKRL